MTKKQVEAHALKLYNECSMFGSSYRICLESMYEVASEKSSMKDVVLLAS